MNGIMELIYGPSGAGKTYHAVHSPDPLVFDYDGGAHTMGLPPERLVRVSKSGDPEGFIKAVNDRIKTAGVPVRTLVFDDLTTLQMYHGFHLMGNQKVAMSGRDVLPKWGTMLVDLTVMVHELRAQFADKGIHVVCVTKRGLGVDPLAPPTRDEDVPKIVCPDFQGKFGGRVGGLFDITVYAEPVVPQQHEPIFRYYFRRVGAFEAKNRYLHLGFDEAYIDNITFTDVVNKIETLVKK